MGCERRCECYRGGTGDRSADPARLRLLRRLRRGAGTGPQPLGFIREAAWPDGGAARRTVQFGVISADRAESRAEAEPSLDAGNSRYARDRYVHDDTVSRCRAAHARDRPQARRRLPGAGVDCPRRSVRRLDYHVLDTGVRKIESFRLWAVLPTAVKDGAATFDPILSLARSRVPPAGVPRAAGAAHAEPSVDPAEPTDRVQSHPPPMTVG